ncbi:hypothetical protein PRZ48_002828 [Zasmidium cellare]|uniref:Thioredoxin domain-containing protein n=1 Tax=Zasmidium cellare TaxID=395010 RepID=A0ABR0EUB7_ZASCE|nr:hypothetical protein PRZ48_002828 [Zasmidium cellare]
MADEPAPSSIAERIAALKLSQVGKVPGTPPPSYQTATNGIASAAPARPRPPPPPRPSLPARPDRPQSTNVPPTQDHVPAANRPIGNQPDQSSRNGIPVNGSNGVSRPALPARTSTQSSQASQGPALPPRRPSERPSPALPPRRPSEAPSQAEYERSRRGSTDSMSSVATGRSSVSGISTATSLTSQGEKYRIRAPEYDPSSLPALPAKRSKEEKEAHDRKYAGLRPLRQTKSSPKVAQIGQQDTTPPPPARPSVVPAPALPSRQPSAQQEAAPEMPPRPGRQNPPPPPSRVEPAPPPRLRQSALAMGFGNKAVESPPVPTARPDAAPSNGAPPPLPTSSKPDLKALLASKPKPNGAAPTPSPAAASAPAKPVAISSYAQYNQIVTSNRLVIADYYADWCGPCRNLAPEYEKLSLQMSRPGLVAFLKINTDHNTDIRDANGIRAWPTIIFYENGREVHKMEGASKEGIQWKVEDLAAQADIDLSAPAVPSSAPAVQAPSAYGAAPSAGGSCLHCRDFSGPDNHAARFPRESIPSTDVGWLAQQLCSPFPSPTDKARAIFTWLHHNIAYNTEAFFSNNVRPSTPQSTLQTGLAVCEGYAGLFAAIAVKAGMEALVVGGHGKGYGYAPLKPGEPVPPYNAGHAWNAVKIDGGEWKLIDCCWGAGTVNGPGQGYKKGFNPEKFTQSNDEFGLDHYPEDSSKQFRNDGRRMTWEEYMLGNKNGCGADFFSGFVAEEGLSKTTFQPQSGKISLSQQHGPTVRFSFQKICPHYDPIRNGKGPYYLYVLHLDSLDGTQRNHIPFETNGEVWWCDVLTQDLGRPGQKVQVYSVTSFDNQEGRGLTIDKYRQRKGRVGYAFGGCCKWEVVP